jgi:hypothetical protein
MELDLRYAFPGNAGHVFGALCSDEYRAESRARSNELQELLEESLRGGHFYRRYRMSSPNELPRPIAAFLKMERFHYELEEHYDKEALTLRWRVIPPKLVDRVTVLGTDRFRTDRDGQCERASTVEITVRIPVIGGQIEKAIARDVRGAYEQGFALDRQWLAQHPPPEGEAKREARG